MIGVKIIGLNEAIDRINSISTGLFPTVMDGIYDSALTLKERAESIEPKYRGKLEVLSDPSLPGAVVVPTPGEEAMVAMKEIGLKKISYMRGRCPRELYFRTRLVKYIEPSNVFNRVVTECREYIKDNIISYLRELFGA